MKVVSFIIQLTTLAMVAMLLLWEFGPAAERQCVTDTECGCAADCLESAHWETKT